MAALAQGFGGTAPGMKKGGMPDILQVTWGFCPATNKTIIEPVIMGFVVSLTVWKQATWHQFEPTIQRGKTRVERCVQRGNTVSILQLSGSKNVALTRRLQFYLLRKSKYAFVHNNF